MDKKPVLKNRIIDIYDSKAIAESLRLRYKILNHGEYDINLAIYDILTRDTVENNKNLNCYDIIITVMK